MKAKGYCVNNCSEVPMSGEKKKCDLSIMSVESRECAKAETWKQICHVQLSRLA